MKKILFIAVALLGMTMTSAHAGEFVNVPSVYAISEEDVTGDYDGNFNRIFMNGEKEVPTDTYTTEILDNGNGTFNLNIEVPKLGSMPGTITIDAKNIQLQSDGTFDQVVNKAIVLKILLTHSYNARVYGSLVNGVLSYTVESVDASYLGIPFSAIVGFSGNKVN